MPYDFNKLTTDVKAALMAASQRAANVEDGGTCNLDGVFLQVPRQREAKMVEALQAAGINHVKKSSWGWMGTGYMLSPNVAGQANKRYAACAAMTASLIAAGHDASHFMQMD